MGTPATRELRVLIADGRVERLESVAAMVAALGHDVVAKETDVPNVGAATAVEDPDVAIVVADEGTEHALRLIDGIVKEASCPVIAYLDVEDADFVNDAARLGIFAQVAGGTPEELQGSIDIALHRFAEYEALEKAFHRRAVTERAKGVLMERHGVDEREAFEMLRDSARGTNRTIMAVSEAVLASHRLLTTSSKGSVGPADPAALTGG
jgi:response regulator NasT